MINTLQEFVNEPLPFTYTYPFVRSDAGKSLSKRPRQSNDCTVRSVALVTGIGYDQVYDEFARLGRKCGQGFHLSDVLNSSNGILGHAFRKISFPARKGESRMNPLKFSQQFPVGNYIVRVAKHVFVFKDGVAYDLFQERDNRCIYLAWKLL